MVLVVAVVRGLLCGEGIEDEDDSGKMRELLARARGRRRPRSGGGEGIEDEGRRRGRLRGMTREF
jgi:hypothetical protein